MNMGCKQSQEKIYLPCYHLRDDIPLPTHHNLDCALHAMAKIREWANHILFMRWRWDGNNLLKLFFRETSARSLAKEVLSDIFFPNKGFFLWVEREGSVVDEYGRG